MPPYQEYPRLPRRGTPCAPPSASATVGVRGVVGLDEALARAERLCRATGEVAYVRVAVPGGDYYATRWRGVGEVCPAAYRPTRDGAPERFAPEMRRPAPAGARKREAA